MQAPTLIPIRSMMMVFKSSVDIPRWLASSSPRINTFNCLEINGLTKIGKIKKHEKDFILDQEAPPKLPIFQKEKFRSCASFAI